MRAEKIPGRPAQFSQAAFSSFNRFAMVVFPRPAQNKLFRIGVEILLTKVAGRSIVQEELLNIPEKGVKP
jgi:hypothetical protein